MNKILEILKTDNTFHLVSYKGTDTWVGKCIQCNRKLYIKTDGTAISEATIEHIMPKGHNGTEDLDNLAIACRTCNNYKGRTIDVLSADNPKFLKVVAKLQEKKLKRAVNT